MLNENYACKSQYIRNINIYIYKYIKQKRIKSQLVNLFRKCSESVPNIIIHDLMEVFITHDESSPPVPFHLAASKVIIVSTPLQRRDELEPHYATIRIHCVHMFVNKEI